VTDAPAVAAVGARQGKTPGGAMPWPCLVVLLLGAFMAILDVFVVNVALPSIQHRLHASPAAIQLVVVGYQLAYATALVAGSRLGDLHGRRRLFILGMAVFTAGSLACGLAPTSTALVAFRLIQGLGAAAMFPQVLSLLRSVIPSSRQPLAFGVLGVVLGSAAVVGQVLGGWLVSANLAGLAWRSVFLINLPVGVATIVAARRLVPESHVPDAHRLDLVGSGLLGGALFVLVLPLVDGQQAGWPPWTYACLAAFAPTIFLFVVWQRRVERVGGDPLIHLPLLTSRAFGIGALLIVAFYACLTPVYLVLALTLQDGLGLKAVTAGLTYTPLGIAFLLSSLVAVRLVRRWGQLPLHAGLMITIGGFTWAGYIAASRGGQLHAVDLIPALVVQGLGEGLFMTPLLALVLGQVPGRFLGTASGALSTAQQVGGALGVALISLVFFPALTGHASGVAAHYAHAFALAMVFAAVAATLAEGLLLFLPRTTPSEGSPASGDESSTRQTAVPAAAHTAAIFPDSATVERPTGREQ
jgi:EmrB/QacA subfamily drug resistance transporter